MADSASVTWDGLEVGSIQTTFLGSGNYRYEANITYASNGLAIDGATVGVWNGSLMATVNSNVTGWITFVLGQGNATSGTFQIYGVNDNNYGITLALTNETFSIYNWTFTINDVTGNPLSNSTTTVTLNSFNVWSGQDHLYLPTATYNVSVAWLQNLPLNASLNVVVGADLTSSFNCLAYPYIVSGPTYWVVSNATISGMAEAGGHLTINFSCPLDSYVLVSNCPTRPTYILNVTYDYATDFSLGYLVLPHYGNATVTMGYELLWGVRIQKTTHRLTSAAFASYTMTLTITGNTGEIGNIELYCGGWGMPESTSGFTVTSYDAGTKVLTCTYTFASDVVASLTWAGGSSPSGPGPGGPSGETGLPSLLKVTLDLPQFVFSTQEINGTITVSWQGTMQVYFAGIRSLATDANYTTYVPGGLPYMLKLSFNGSNVDTLPFYLYIPSNVSLGEHRIPFNVDLATATSQTKTFTIIVYITVQEPAKTIIVPAPSDLITILFVAMFVSLIVPILFRTQRVRARRSRTL